MTDSRPPLTLADLDAAPSLSPGPASHNSVLSLSEAAEVAESLPLTYIASKQRPVGDYSSLVEAWGALGREHAEAALAHAESGTVLGVRAPDIISIRHTHHRLAQYLSMGMDETKAARLCNYTKHHVSALKHSPAFIELLAYYADGVEAEFADFVSSASDLSMDMLGRLREVLETQPEKLTPTHLMEAIKLLADRTGHAPVSRSVSLNVNADLGSRLKAGRERADSLLKVGEG